MVANPSALAEIRAQLDEIDTELHALLIRRSTLAPQVVAAKGGGPFWRPTREAQILRTRIEHHEGGFPHAALARIWCEIIAGMISMETDFRVTLWEPDSDNSLRVLVHDYFGLVPPVSRAESAAAALKAAWATYDTVAVLPWPGDGAAGAWWPLLMDPALSGLGIAFRLPFVGSETLKPAACLARIPLEASGLDRTVVVLEAAAESRLAEAVAVAKDLLGAEQIDAQGCLALLEIRGFVGADDRRLSRLSEASAVQSVRVVGAYAVPLGQSS